MSQTQHMMVMFFTPCEYKGRRSNSDQSFFVGMFFDNEYNYIKFMILILNVILVLWKWFWVHFRLLLG